MGAGREVVVGGGGGGVLQNIGKDERQLKRAQW